VSFPSSRFVDLQKWIESVVKSDIDLLMIPLTSSSKKSPFKHQYISEKSGIPLPTLGYFIEPLAPILVEALKKKGWLVDGVPLLEQDIVRRLRLLLLNFKENKALLKTKDLVVKNSLNKRAIYGLLGGGTQVENSYPYAVKYYNEEFEPAVFELLEDNAIYDRSDYMTFAERKKSLKYRRGRGDLAKDISSFVEKFIDESDFKTLLKVQCQQSKGKDDCLLNLSWVARQINQLGDSDYQDTLGGSISAHYYALLPLEDKLKSEGVWIEGVNGISMNLINSLRLLLLEFENDPKLLKTPKLRAGKKISRRAMQRSFPSLINFNVTQACSSHPQVNHFWINTFEPHILASMNELNHFDSESYKTVKERIEMVDVEVIELAKEKSRMVTLYLNSDSHTYNEIRSNSLSDELLHLYAVSARGTKALDKSIHSSLIKYFSEQGVSADAHLPQILDEYSAIKFRVWLEDRVVSKSLGAQTAHGYIHVFQRMLQSYYDLDDIDKSNPFIRVGGFSGATRSTETYKPYVKEHRDLIANVLDEAINSVREQHFQEYEKSSVGETFVGSHSFGLPFESVLADKCSLQNLRWYFDNELNSTTVYRSHYNNLPKSDVKCLFWKAWQAYRKSNEDAPSSITAIYDGWAVPRPPNLHEIIPYYLKLLQVTGLNAESASNLTLDSYLESHPATGRPCIRYFKTRGEGNQEMPLDLFDADITWISKSQSKIVSSLITDILRLTQNIRNGAGKYRNHLFIYQNDLSVSTNKILSLAGSERGRVSKRANEVLGQFDGKWINQLVDKDGEVVKIITTRFRPSLVSELVDVGVSIREIQLILGHSAIQTTLKYLDGLDFNKIARTKIFEKLNEIYSNAFVPKKGFEPAKTEVEEGEIIFKTPLGGCKDIMNPPDFISKSIKSKSGACDKYNQCLRCSNVIITTSQLPQLFALQRDYLQAVTHQRIISTPYGGVIMDNLAVLEAILGDDSNFSRKELDEASRLSKYIESSIIIDGVIA
jgi:integrase